MRAASHFMPPVARVVPALLLVIIAAAAVAFLSPFHLNQLTLVAAYCIALVGLNLVVGLAGQISLAHRASTRALSGDGNARTIRCRAPCG